MESNYLGLRFPSLVGAVGFAVVLLLCLPGNLQSVSGISVEDDLLLTMNQKKILDKFKQEVGPLLYRDWMKFDIYLIRWLRARNFDPVSAEAMLRAHLHWRKDRKMDTILQENWSDVAKDFHATIDTYDRQGRPIGVIDIYDWDIRTGALRGKSQRLLRYMDYLLESITSQVFERQAKGMNVTQWKVLGNADGFNLIEHGCPICLPLWIQFVQSLEANYPGWLDEFIVIDAPTTINVVLEAVRPFLSKNTREALKVFGPNRNKWLPYIDQRISKDQRRPQYGGTKPLVARH